MSRHRRSGFTNTRSSRIFGAGTAVSAFLAFGMVPATAPAAHADVEDVWIDLFGEGLWDAIAGVGANWGDQDAWTVVLDPASWTPFFDSLGSQATWDALLSDLSLSAIGAGSLDLPGAADASFNWGDIDWLRPFGNGADGTALNPDGAAGGWIWGSGGDGWNADGTGGEFDGGSGGQGGLFGGDGGAGGDGYQGGDGGDGGAAGLFAWFSRGGDGGDGGDAFFAGDDGGV
ncbi:PGRS repeat-containing protein, partial [Mycolicibacter arupensis]|uniref:PGRS repeat-containing protein n=1 Tax=Mycolicibacter arupensis TaxID=342002 RepID=UPI003B3BB29D